MMYLRVNEEQNQYKKNNEIKEHCFVFEAFVLLHNNINFCFIPIFKCR